MYIPNKYELKEEVCFTYKPQKRIPVWHKGILKRTVNRRQGNNHLEIIIRSNKKENAAVLEEEIKRAILRCNRSLNKDIGYEILTIDDRNNDPAVKQWKMHDNVDRTVDAVCDWIQKQIKDDSICIEGGAVAELKSDNIELGGVVPLPGGWKGVITEEVEKIGSSKPERGEHERTD